MNLNEFILGIISLLKLQKYSDQIESLLNSQNLLFIIIYLTSLSAILSLGIYKIIKNKSILLNKFLNLNVNLNLLTNTIIKQRIYLIFIIPVALILFLIFYLPPTYDEAFTFVNFIDRGIIISMAYYPSPNNHVFYSVIGSFFNFFNFKSIIPFRIISGFFFLASLITIFKIFLKDSLNLKNYYYILISVFPLSFVYIYSSSLARGYSLLIFLTLINIYLIQKILKSKNDEYLKTFSLFTSLAFYTIPSYFYCHTIFCIIIFFFKKNSFKYLIKSNTIILLITLILFFPIIIFQGYDFIFNTNLLQRINYNQFFFYITSLKEILEQEIFGISILIILILLIISLYFSIKIKKLKEFLALLFIIIFTLFLPYLTKTIPPGRTFHLVYMLTLIMIFLPTKIITKKINKKNLIILCFLIQTILSINILRHIPVEKYSINAEEYSKKILGHNKSYFLCSNLYDPLLIYFKNKYQVRVNKIDLSKNIFCDVQKVTGYDWVIIDKKRDESIIKPDFSSILWNFYKK